MLFANKSKYRSPGWLASGRGKAKLRGTALGAFCVFNFDLPVQAIVSLVVETTFVLSHKTSLLSVIILYHALGYLSIGF